MKNKKPKTVWAFWANMYGPWYKTPQKAYLEDYTLRGEKQAWWHKNGDSDITKLGFYEREDGGYTTFSSIDKKQVEHFMLGYNACRKMYKDCFSD